MSYKKEFEKGLDKLWKYRRDNFLAIVGGQHRRKMSRKEREKEIKNLSNLVIETMIRDKKIRQEFNQTTKKIKRLKISKGNLQKRFNKFFQRAIEKIHNRKFIYIFWGKEKKCLYVGESRRGIRRLRGYRRSIIFKEARKVEIRVPVPKGLAKLECMAIHILKPKYNEIKGPKRKYARKCPICRNTKRIRKELRNVFAIKR